MTEYVPAGSEQFQVEPGSVKISLKRTMPGVAGGETSGPATGGGATGAQGCALFVMRAAKVGDASDGGAPSRKATERNARHSSGMYRVKPCTDRTLASSGA